MTTFGDKTRKLGIEKKMTQQKLGVMVGVFIEQFDFGEVHG